MTPTATTPAARRGAKKGTAARTGPPPRRVSGPVGGRAGSARPSTAPPTSRPRRTRARPSTAPATSRPRRTRAPRTRIAPRLASFVRGLPDHSLLDRLIRGRAWIPVLGVMLAGIVAMQVEVLKLGATMGRAIERGSALQTRNELLRESVATLADDQRIIRLASSRLGMIMPAPGGVGFLQARGANTAKAAANIKPPDGPAFSSLLTSNSAITQTPGVVSAAPATSITSGSSTSGSSPTSSVTPSSSTGAAAGTAGG
jgi:hypothetical protein